MSDDDWREISLTASSSASAIVTSAIIGGLPDIAKAAVDVEHHIVYFFNFAPGPDAIPDSEIAQLEVRVRELEKQLEQSPDTRSRAFRCKDEFDEDYLEATTKAQKASCLMAYVACLALRS